MAFGVTCDTNTLILGLFFFSVELKDFVGYCMEAVAKKYECRYWINPEENDICMTKHTVVSMVKYRFLYIGDRIHYVCGCSSTVMIG